MINCGFKELVLKNKSNHPVHTDHRETLNSDKDGHLVLCQSCDSNQFPPPVCYNWFLPVSKVPERFHNTTAPRLMFRAVFAYPVAAKVVSCKLSLSDSQVALCSHHFGQPSTTLFPSLLFSGVIVIYINSLAILNRQNLK